MSNIILIQKDKRLLLSQGLLSEISRFITTGGVNTLLTLLLYQLLVTYISPQWSYAIAWLSGFVVVSVAYPRYVFRSGRASTQQLFLLLLLYGSSFFIGLLLMDLSVDWHVHERLSVVAVIVVTSTINYIFAKLLFNKQNKQVIE